jgi:hypothetical protein
MLLGDFRHFAQFLTSHLPNLVSMKPLYPLLALATFVALAGAQTVSTDPVGFIPIVAKGNSDTYLALPLHRGLSFQGTVASVNQNTLSVNSAAFQTDGYKDTHYVLIASGAKEGMWYAITTNSPTAVTIELAGDTLGTAVASGTEIQIIPFWTLATLFPGGVGVHASPSFLPRTSVLSRTRPRFTALCHTLPRSASLSLTQPQSAACNQPQSAAISLSQPLSASLSLAQPRSASLSLAQPCPAHWA